MKTKLNIIGLVFLILCIIFVFPIYGSEKCPSSQVGQTKCIDGVVSECDESQNWNISRNCEDGCNTTGTDCLIKTTENVEDGGSLIPKYPNEVFIEDGDGVLTNQGLTIGTIFSKLLEYVYVIAGLILLVMLIMGGLGLMTAAGNADKMKAGYGKITNALIGFLIIFISYFVVQLVETILGIKII